jgi:hypothetical protein
LVLRCIEAAEDKGNDPTSLPEIEKDRPDGQPPPLDHGAGRVVAARPLWHTKEMSGCGPMTSEIDAKRTRLAAVERELARLFTRYDLAMSGFRFDEAREVQQQIGAFERERAELVATLPASAPPVRTVPRLVGPRPRPVRRQHRRR